MPRDLLKDLQAAPDEAIEFLEEKLRERRQGPDGQEHPLYSWRPGCPPYEQDGWYRPGKLTFQKDVLTCESFLIGVCTSNGVGKTETGCRLVAARLRGEDPLTERKWEIRQEIWVLTEPDLIPDLFDDILRYIPQKERGRVHKARGHQFVEHKNGNKLTMKSTGMTREQFQKGNINFIWADEEAPAGIWQECVARLRMPDSQIMLSFTPVNGTQFMYDTLEMAKRDEHEGKMEGELALFFAKMEDSPFLPPEYIERMKKACERDPDMYAIRIEGEYRLMGGRVIFNEAVLKHAWDNVCEPECFVRFDLEGNLLPMQDDNTSWAIWKHPVVGHKYVIGADLAEGGLEGDYTAAHVLDVTTGEFVARFHGKLEPGEFAKDLMLAGYYYDNAVINWEMNMQGAAVWHVVQEWKYPRIYRRESMGGKIKTAMQTAAFRTDRHSKPAIISALRDATSDGVVVYHDQMTLDEMTHFAYLRKQDSSARTMGMGALPGCHDDLVMSAAITWKTASQSESRAYVEKPPPTFMEFLEEDALEAVRRLNKRQGRPTNHPRILR